MIVAQKASMKFANDEEFLKNEEKIYNSNLQLSDNITPVGVPIGQLMSQRFGADKVLTGTALDDEEDTSNTLKSLEEAEKQYGKKMNQPSVSKEFYRKTGSKFENMMAGDSRITSQMLDEGTKTESVDLLAQKKKKEEEIARKKAADDAAKAKAKAEQQIAIHFHDDDGDFDDE